MSDERFSDYWNDRCQHAEVRVKKLEAYNDELMRRLLVAETAHSIAERTPDAFELTAQREVERIRAEAAEAEVERLCAALRETVDAVTAVALDWRYDWSDFDGRTLVAQVGEATEPARAALAVEETPTEEDDDG